MLCVNERVHEYHGRERIMRNLKMKLFGNFTFGDKNVSISEMTLRSKKLLHLLVYILLNRDEVLTQQNLIDMFWEDRAGNPEGALKNMMYRLRNVLKELGDEDFICTVPGAYQWNPEVHVETDYEAFEELADQLRKRIPRRSVSEQKKLCQEITERYQGNVTPRVADEPWILSRVIWYRSIYTEAAKSLSSIYEAEKSWVSLEQLCDEALTVDPLDEDLQCHLLRALFGQKKYDLAILRYEKAGKLFYENIGVQHPEKLEAVFRELMSGRQELVTDLDSFMDEIEEQQGIQGAFFCDYQIFRQIYRIEARRVNRMGTAEYVMMMTVNRKGRLWKNLPEDHQILIEGSEILARLLQRHLRGGDVATQYSPTQFIVLLPTCTYESGVMVARRIQKQFDKSIGLRKLEVTYELAEIPAVE